jgi:hypothetical protein
VTINIKGSFWCCGGIECPYQTLFHNPSTGKALLATGSIFYGAYTPILTRTRREAKAYADEWNAMYKDASLRVTPRRVVVTINLDAGERKEAPNGKQA